MRTARAAFGGVVVALLVIFALICACEPILGDSWQHYAEARQPLTWERFLALAEGWYREGNPRWGQLALALMARQSAVAVVVTPLVILGVLLLSMTLIRARWPRPSDPADTRLLVRVLATAIVTAPGFGTIWFYRPNCTNYVYPLLVQLAWLVPYRFLEARRLAASWSRCIAIMPLGLLAGAGNEHTGIGLLVAAAACTCASFRRDRSIPPWTIVGMVSLVIGYHALITAPGQMVRYAGLAAGRSPLDVIIERGLIGNVAFVGLGAAWATVVLVTIVLVAGRSRWRQARVSRAAAGCVVVAAVMVATSLAAPIVPARLWVAPATMIALGLGIYMSELAAIPSKARRLGIASIAISAIALGLALVIAIVTGIEGRARLRKLSTTPRGSITCVVPYRFSATTPFSWGDDFRRTAVSERVSRIFGLARIDRPCP